jgi:4'-phosphopantetheinyl transferase
VGIDLEFPRKPSSATQLALRYFTLREQYLIRSLPLSHQQAAILECWTRKEAYVKAIGTGLADGLRYFEVPVPPQAPAQIRVIPGECTEVEPWTMRPLPMPRGYHATLVVEGRDWIPQYMLLEVDSKAFC